jgi:hypothetical protein
MHKHNRNRIVGIVLLLSFCIVLMACPSGQMTKDQNYLAATQEFDSFMTRYTMYYGQQTKEVKAQWDEKYGKTIDLAWAAHDTWKKARVNGTATIAQEQTFMDLKNMVIDFGFDLWGKN